MDSRPFHLPPPCTEPLQVLHVDDALVIVNKPAFLLSVPGRGPLKQDCVQHRLADQYDDIRLIHRLDLDTSGLMVFARGADAQKFIARHFQERRVKKEYHARVAGLVNQDEGEIELPIITDWINRPRQKISEDGKWALTRYRVLQRDPASDSTLVSLEPFTGRSHQLRIHMRELGHPILGCDLYAPEDILARSPRLLLHACKLGLTHPVSGQWQVYECPPPFS
ncbi:MAG: RluA family pseudouridine synthase [Alcanivoracaceae bacterium]|jgi:tRNA pseudouridine32 synthase / 23S rRNA pseudouridine746 synthase|nr:RluA family pseudouridine synthase [Alcanivoracaceae bacterium]